MSGGDHVHSGTVRIQGRDENNKRNKSFKEELCVFLILYWARFFLYQSQVFLYPSKNDFSYLFCQRLLFTGVSFGLPLLRFGRGVGQMEGKKVWWGTSFL
ncbi:hypothetical protein BS78_05G134000 [Paspalum vaginatum]|nr:hypothetical protein BS78_05G134000 [Paspalum vaginatum]